MTPEEIRVGQGTSVQVSTFTIGTSTSNPLGADPNRIGLVLCAPVTNRVTIGRTAGFAIDRGITAQPSQAPIILDLNSVGSFLTEDIAFIASAAATSITCFIITSTSK